MRLRPRFQNHAAAFVIKPLRLSSLASLAVLLGALAFLAWVNAGRIRHVQQVSALGGGSERPAVAAPAATELTAGNGLIVPGQLTESYHWLAQTQRMFNRGEWRVRHIDYENAPFGRAVHTPSPYRWWLGLVTWGEHLVSGRSSAQSVERAALVADPLLHALLLVVTALLVAWRFGAWPAALAAFGCATLFPLAAGFLPGAPDDHGAALVFALWSVLFLVAGAGSPRAKSWFALAGVAGGLGLWLSVSGQGPILVGIAVGALFAGWIARSPGANAILPWRGWAVAGATTTFVAYLVEFAPAHLGEWQLGVIHPLHGLAWLGAGELLARAAEWIQTGKRPQTFRSVAAVLVALAALAALPVVIAKVHGAEFLVPEASSFRLTRSLDGAAAKNLATWMVHAGPTASVWATLLPLLLVIPAGWLLLRQPAGSAARVAGALAFGPVLIAFGFACSQLAWWNVLDGLLLVLLVAVATEPPGAPQRPSARLAWLGVALLLMLPGAWCVAPQGKAETESDPTRSEVLGLIERDLAGWLALHADPAEVVLLAPPKATTALCYYGGVRGLGSLSRENKDGLAAAVLILANPNPQEAKALIDRRNITHLVLLSWDSAYDDYTRADTAQSAGTLRDKLQPATLPPWLRPLAYPLPVIPGFEGQSAQVFEVVDEQEPATALARIAEYLLEIKDLDQAAAAAQGLRRFPTDFGAWVARAEVDLARGDEAEFAKSLKVLQARLATKYPAALPWDLRVGLAVVLARAKQEKLAREQVAACLAVADERKLRSLSPGSLYRLLVLSRGFGTPVEPKLHEFALTLVPAELRDRVR